MAIPSAPLMLLFLLIVFISQKNNPLVEAAQIDSDSDSGFKLTVGALQWPATASTYNGIELELDEDQEEGIESKIMDRRSLYWRSMPYYISYGALSANRIPCPARSGRSYYTHNCYRSSGPAHPYTRGCSAITRCRR